MPKIFLINNATIINENKRLCANLLIKDGIIDKISKFPIAINNNATLINAEGLLLMPGVIDDQVHFRDPGLTYKADIETDSIAAVAGGITSFMDMPNTIPNALSIEILENKYNIAAKKSVANYSFYMGASNDNITELMKINASNVCGIKVFMGSSTGNMLVDSEVALNNIFSKLPNLIAVHCEDEEIIKQNTKFYKQKYGDNIPFYCHNLIRSNTACFKSSSKAVEMAKRYSTRLHLLHLTTSEEIKLLSSEFSHSNKQITAEVCAHHLWFTNNDYEALGGKIKCNPAIKTQNDRDNLRKALINNKIDVIATDHAPHTIDEKNNKYLKCPSGLPLVQHSLIAMLELCDKGIFSEELVVEKMCHAPSRIFKIKNRGFIKEGYKADITIVNQNENYIVNSENILYKCNWSPFKGYKFKNKIKYTFVNGNLVWNDGVINTSNKGERILFNN